MVVDEVVIIVIVVDVVCVIVVTIAIVILPEIISSRPNGSALYPHSRKTVNKQYLTSTILIKRK